MKIRQMAAAVGLCVAMLPASALMYPLQQDAGSTSPNGAGQQPPPSSATPPPATASTTQQPEPQGAAPLRVMVGKSLLINTTERLKRVSVTDPAVADALVVTPTQILVHGRAPGEVSLLIWDELERSRSFDLRVDVDVSAAAEEERRVFPDEQITVTPSRPFFLPWTTTAWRSGASCAVDMTPGSIPVPTMRT